MATNTFSIAGEWLAPVGSQHVVDEQQIAALPVELDGFAVVSAADLSITARSIGVPSP